MSTAERPNGLQKWPLYQAYARLAVCLLLLPLLLTIMVRFAEARAVMTAAVLAITGCLYCDISTVTRRSRAA